MTILSTNGVIVYRPFRGYDDPGLPRGTWLAVASVTGDGSGGIRRAIVLVSPAAHDSRFYSLEQVSLFEGRNTDIDAMVSAEGFDDTPIGTKTNAVAVQGVADGAAAAGFTRDSLPRRFLGQQGRTTAQTVIQADIGNADGIVFVAAFEGYWWDPEAVNAPNGGIRRPQDGLYV